MLVELNAALKHADPISGPPVTSEATKRSFPQESGCRDSDDVPGH